MRKAKIFLINSIILTSTSFIIRTVSMSFNIYISNKVGAECTGLFQLILSVYLFAITVATSGISIAATRLVTEEMAKNNNNGAKVVIKKCIIYSLLLGLLAGLLIIFLSDFIVTKCLHNKISKMPLYAIAIGLPFISMSSAINGYFSAVRKVFKTASSQILEQFVKIFATSFLLSLFLPKGIEYACLSLIIGDVISEVISFTYIFILYLNDKNKVSNSGNIQNKNYKKEILSISLPIAFTSYIKSGLSTLKQLIIPIRLEKSGLSCQKALSDYGIVSGMALPLLLFPSVIITSISSLLIPEFSTFYAKNDTTQINRISFKLLKITFIFSICVFGIFFTFPEELSTLMYKDTNVVFYLKLLSPLIILMYIDTIVDGMLKGLNEQVAVMKCNILDLFISTILIYILLPIMGIMGYIVVLYISEILNVIISTIQLVKVSKLKIKYFNWTILPIAGIMLSRYTIKFFNININSNIFSLIVEILLFVLIYLGFLSFASIITKKDFKI